MALALLINGYTRSGVLREFCPHFGPQPLAVIPHRRDLFEGAEGRDRKSTRLNSSHSQISYAVFCLKKKKAWTVSDETRAAFRDAMSRVLAAAHILTTDGPAGNADIRPSAALSGFDGPSTIALLLIQ